MKTNQNQPVQPAAPEAPADVTSADPSSGEGAAPAPAKAARSKARPPKTRPHSFRLTEEAYQYLVILEASQSRDRTAIISDAIIAVATAFAPTPPPQFTMLSFESLRQLRFLNAENAVVWQQILLLLRQIVDGSGGVSDLRLRKEQVDAALTRLAGFETALRREMASVGQIGRDHAHAVAMVYELALNACAAFVAQPEKERLGLRTARDWWAMAELCQLLRRDLSSKMPLPPKPKTRLPSKPATNKPAA